MPRRRKSKAAAIATPRRRSRGKPDELWFADVLSYRLLLVLTAGLGLGYLALSHLPGREAKDWVHLWIAGRMVWDGEFTDLYNPQSHERILQETYPDGLPPGIWPERNTERLGAFFYPPPAAFYYAAFGWLPQSHAATVHCVLIVALALAAGWLLSGLTQELLWPASGALALLSFPPFFYNYALGQNAMATAIVVLAAWWLANRRRDLAAGMVLGLLVCKPNWLVAMAWIPLLHGRVRLLLGMGLGAAGVLGATLPWCGWEPFEDYVRVFGEVLQLPAESGYVLRLKISALGLTRKWFGVGPMSTLTGWASAMVVVVLTWRRWRGAWQPGRARFQRMMASSVLAALWINPHLNNYDLVLVAACGAVLFADAGLSTAQRSVLVGVLALSYVSGPWDNHWSHWRQVPVPSFALLALWAWSISPPRVVGPLSTPAEAHAQRADLSVLHAASQ